MIGAMQMLCNTIVYPIVRLGDDVCGCCLAWGWRPPHYSHGGVSEMQLTLAQTYDAWVETPGALEWLGGKVTS